MTPIKHGTRHGAITHVRRKVPIGYNGSPKFAPKSTPSRGPIPKLHYLPHPWTRPTYDANGIRIQSAVFPQCTGHTDAHMDAPTDRSFTGEFDDYRPLRYKSDAA